MDEKEFHDLYKLKLSKDVKDEVTAWIKKSVIIISVLSLFGTNFITAAFIKSFMQKDIDSLHEAIGKFHGKKEVYESNLKKLDEENIKLSKKITEQLSRFNDLENFYREQDSLINSRNALNTARIHRISKIFEESFKNLNDTEITSDSFNKSLSACYDAIYALNLQFEENRPYNIELLSTSDIPSNFYPMYRILVNSGFLVRNYGNTPLTEIEDGYDIDVSTVAKDTISILYEKKGHIVAQKLKSQIEDIMPDVKVQTISSPKHDNNNQIDIGIFIN